MDGTGPDGQVQWLLSQMVGTFLSADQSSDCDNYSHHMNAARKIAEDLRLTLETRGVSAPPGLDTFLETVERATADGHCPEDRELLGLMDWATQLYEKWAGADSRLG